MLRPLRSTFKRKVKKRNEVSRSFRVPKEVDRLLDQESAKRGWSKSFLIRDVLHSWYTFNKAKEKLE